MKNIISRKNFICGIVLLTVMVLGFINGRLTVNAQDYSAADVFFAMNDIRAVFGLEPYVMRDDLMQLAQSHAEYMAEIQSLTHTREDGSQPNVTAENVSLGPIQIAVNTWMDDQPHKDTILAWSKGWAGAGIALSENGYVYISFDMIRMPDAVYKQIFDPYPPIATEDPNLPTLAPGEPTRTAIPGINQFIFEVVQSTPDADGYVWHEVKNGQTLWAIATAYGVSEERVIGLNNLNANNPVIYAGEKLLVDIVDPPVATATPAPTVTGSPTPLPTRSVTPTLRATKIAVTETLVVTTVQTGNAQEMPKQTWILVLLILLLVGAGVFGYHKGWFSIKR
ncbi:MAG: LysM peptidoglycan-binding domain-containing protein [Anaerolineae bacterium]|nr:LysM peptidoglycan-binding domain-containing protein [Anaerolineae bacterium]